MRPAYTIAIAPNRTAHAYAHPDPDDNGVWWLDDLYVPAAHRRNGCAATLLHQLIEDADFEGITVKLIVEASGDMPPEELAAWYGRCGFVPDPYNPEILTRYPQ